MKNFVIEIKWAVIFTILFIVWNFGEKIAGLHDSHIDKPFYSYLFAIPAVAIYVFALIEKKKKYFQGKMSWQQGFISGIFVSLFIAVLSPISQYITYEIISPDFFNNTIEYQLSRNVMTESFAKANFNLSSSMKRAVSDTMSMGILTSAVVALIVKTKTPLQS
jgi:hypothetical protein